STDSIFARRPQPRILQIARLRMLPGAGPTCVTAIGPGTHDTLSQSSDASNCTEKEFRPHIGTDLDHREFRQGARRPRPPGADEAGLRLEPRTDGDRGCRAPVRGGKHSGTPGVSVVAGAAADAADRGSHARVPTPDDAGGLGGADGPRPRDG